jgi:hypothetical protein
VNPIGNIVSGNTNGSNGACSGGVDSSSYSFNLATAVGGAVAYGAAAMQEMIHAVSSNKQVVQFSFSKLELQNEVRFTQSEEFIYRGEHYDVISSHQDGNKTIYRCVNDERETSLFTWFRKNLDHQDAGSANSKVSFKPLAADWLISSDPLSTVQFSSLTISQEPTFILQTIQTEIPTPPPNGCA